MCWQCENIPNKISFKLMKTYTSAILVLLLLVSFCAFSQIKVLSDGKVGLGANNTNPTYPVDIKGATAIRPGTGSAFININENASYGWTLNSSTQNTGYIGLYGYLYAVSASYVYSQGLLCTSDEKIKNNIKPLINALSTIKQLKPVSFDYNIDYSNMENGKIMASLQKDDKNRLGFIAQEVQKVLPQSVKHKDSDSILCIRMLDFIPLLVKGMQEQTVRIDSLKSVIDQLKASEVMLKKAIIPGYGNSLNSTAILDQNIPNPFSRETKIGCFIPEKTGTSVIYIYNMNGTQLQQYSINGKGQQTVTIFGNTLEPGMYLYALVVDGREVDTKRMILTK